MQPNAFGPSNGVGLWIGLAVAMVILVLRNRKPRALRIELLWIRPLIFVVLIALTLVGAPPPATAISLGILGVAAVVGAALGWQRGRFIHIEVHSETHALTTRVSPFGLLFIAGLIALRAVFRGAAMGGTGGLHIPAVTIVDALILFGGAMMITQSVEIWLRARRVLAEAKGESR